MERALLFSSNHATTQCGTTPATYVRSTWPCATHCCTYVRASCSTPLPLHVLPYLTSYTDFSLSSVVRIYDEYTNFDLLMKVSMLTFRLSSVIRNKFVILGSTASPVYVLVTLFSQTITFILRQFRSQP